MKEISFYLFLFLFFIEKSKELKRDINKISDGDIIYNYIEFDDGKKYLLNPRSEKVVLFTNSNTMRNLKSENNEIDYFDFLKLKLNSNDNIKIKIDDKEYEFDKVYSYVFENKKDTVYKDIEGYIGIKNGANFIKKLKLDKKHGYKQKFNSDSEQFYFGKEVKIDDDYDDDDKLASIEPALDDDDELSLSLSQFTFKSIDKINDKYQYQIEKENDNYIDSENKVFISLFLNNFHIAPTDWIEKVLKKSGIKDNEYNKTNDVSYLNKNLYKYQLINSGTKKTKKPDNFNFIFDLSTAVKIKLFNEKNEVTFLGYDKEVYKTKDIFLSNSLLNYSVNYNFEDSVLTIIGDEDNLTDIESFVPVVLFIISCVIVIIIIIGVVFIIRKNKNNNANIDNQDSNNAGLVPN